MQMIITLWVTLVSHEFAMAMKTMQTSMTVYRNQGGDRSEAWDRETMFSQLAKRSSQNVDSGVRHNKYFRSTINFNMRNSLQNLCVFCRGKVNGERLISHGTYCQFRTREYSMEATSMKTLLFSHCLVCCSGEWISCELFILGDQVCEKRFKVEC